MKGDVSFSLRQFVSIRYIKDLESSRPSASVMYEPAKDSVSMNISISIEFS